MSAVSSGPSRRSLIALDALCAILADVRGGLGPFLAVYLASEHGWGPAPIGMALAVMGVSGLVAQAPAGALIDAARNKRAIVAAALGLVAAGAIAMVALPAPPVVLSAQALIGGAGAVFGPATAAISLGLVGHAGLARRLGRNHAFDHAGNVVAALAAGLIADSVGYGATFVLAAGTCLLGMAATMLIRGPDIDNARARGAGASGAARAASLRELVADRRILVFAAVVVLFHFANAAMLPLVGQKLALLWSQGSGRAMSACIIAAQLVMVPTALLAGRLAESWGRKPTLLIAFAVLPVRGVLCAWCSGPYELVAAQLLDGLGAGVLDVVAVLVVADLVRGSGRFNLAQGALAAAVGLGASISNLAAGAVVQAAGFGAAFLVLATIAAVAAALLALAMPETRCAETGPGPETAVPAVARKTNIGPVPQVAFE